MLKPLNDNVIVKPLDKEETSQGGIILPDTVSKEKPEKGEVLAVGPGKVNEMGNRMPMQIRVGDRVIFTKYAPNEIKLNNNTVLVLSEADILAIETNDPEPVKPNTENQSPSTSGFSTPAEQFTQQSPKENTDYNEPPTSPEPPMPPQF